MSAFKGTPGPWNAEIAVDLLDAMRRVLIRAIAHPDDDDAERKRNLYHIEHIARVAIAKATGEQS